jgi:hypothetical protein
MGGTAKTASGGIVGVITGFASICVARLEVHYGADTPVRVDGTAGLARHLAIGQVVVVEAEGVGNSLQARSVEVVHALSGPVEQMAASGAVVAGRRVTMSLQDPAVAASANAGGTSVHVSALPGTDGTLLATRIDLASASEPGRLVGTVTRLAADRAEIDSQRVSIHRSLARLVRVAQEVRL